MQADLGDQPLRNNVKTVNPSPMSGGLTGFTIESLFLVRDDDDECRGQTALSHISAKKVAIYIKLDIVISS